MLELLKDLLWDRAAGRAVLVWLGSVLGGVLIQPAGRTLTEKLMWSALASLAPAAASLPSSITTPKE